MKKLCGICKKTVYVTPSRFKLGRGKYCSRKCLYSSEKWRSGIGRAHLGKVGFWKGKKMSKEHRKKLRFHSLGNKHALGYKHTPEALEKIRLASTGKNSYLWRGNRVSYGGLHSWVSRHLGRPKKCSSCGVSDRWLHWANKSHEYKRELGDWIGLCVPCHKKYDSKSSSK